MKKLPFYIMLGVAVTAVAALAVMEIRRRTRPATTGTLLTGEDYLLSESSQVNQTFKGFNYDLTLNKNTKKGEGEITALQHLINAYYGGTQSLTITGKYDTATKNAVHDITGKTSTSLYEFNYYYLVPQRGQSVGDTILNNLRTK